MRSLLDSKDAERPQRQTATVAREPDHSCPLSEDSYVHLDGQGTLQGNTILSSLIGKDPGTRREAGVGFAIANKLDKELPVLPNIYEKVSSPSTAPSTNGRNISANY